MTTDRSTAGHTGRLLALGRTFMGAFQPGVGGPVTALRTLPRMIRAGLSGRYPGLSRRTLGLMALATVYVLSPVDLIPELVVPLLGFGDDAVVVVWLAGSLALEVERFRAWEIGQGGDGRVVPGEVVRGDVVRGEVVTHDTADPTAEATRR